MLDLIRCRGRGARFAALTLAAVTIFALVLVATPASAADPTDVSNFSPNDTEIDATGDAEAVVMSDRNDGTNSTFRVNTVATQDTASVDWYYCPDTYAGTDPTLGGSGCTLAGTDSSGVTPPGAGTDGTDKTFELEFNVPDDLAHDWVAWACTQTPKTDANCDQEKEENVQFDDSSTGTPASQSSAGFITAPPNGSGQGSDSYDLFATTSPDVDAVLFCSRETADADTDPSGPGICDDAHSFTSPINPPAQQSQFKLWGEALDTGAHCATCENGWVLFETAGGATNSLPPGADNCSGDGFDCQLDTVYITESPSEPTSVKLAFPDYGEPSTTPNDCDEPEAVQTASDTPGQLFDVQGCIFDQSGSSLTDSEHWAFQVSPMDPDSNTSDTLGFDGTGGFTEGDENDTNGDSFFEQVDGDPTNSGSIAEQSIDLDSGGTYTVTFCRDSDDNADDFASPQSGTPCSGEALSATGTLNLTPVADHVHVKKQGTEGPQCHTGSSSTTAPAGSTVNLVGCALGTVAGAGATLEQPAPNTHVLWIVNPANQPQDPGQIITQENSTDSAGKADAAISSGGGAAEKTSTIRFCIDEFPATGGANAGNGICDAFEAGRQPDPALQADFQINWTAAAAPPGGACPLKKKTGTSGDDKLSGGPGCDKLLGKKGDDKLKGKGGNDVLVGGPGNDILIGGPGEDKCRGGAGQDKLKNC